MLTLVLYREKVLAKDSFLISAVTGLSSKARHLNSFDGKISLMVKPQISVNAPIARQYPFWFKVSGAHLNATPPN
jgi:hypothetical protein